MFFLNSQSLILTLDLIYFMTFKSTLLNSNSLNVLNNKTIFFTF